MHCCEFAPLPERGLRPEQVTVLVPDVYKRQALSTSLQETEGHRQMWELSHSGQLGSNLQLQDHFIKDFLLPKLEYNYERFQGIMGDPHRLRPYIGEYTCLLYPSRCVNKTVSRP